MIIFHLHSIFFVFFGLDVHSMYLSFKKKRKSINYKYNRLQQMWHLSQVLLSHIWKWFSNQIAKQECGLGLQVTRPKNLALKALLLWRAHNSGHELWASVLANKYFSWAHNGNRWLNVKGSRTWNELRRGWAIFAKGSHRTIQNGSITRVWLNEWIARMSLMDLTMGPLFTPWIHSFCPRCPLG